MMAIWHQYHQMLSVFDKNKHIVMSDNLQLIDELLATIALIEVTPDVFEGKSHDYVGSRIFGGQVLAQAIMAGARR